MPNARHGEDDHRQEPAEAGGLLDHGIGSPRIGEPSVGVPLQMPAPEGAGPRSTATALATGSVTPRLARIVLQPRPPRKIRRSGPERRRAEQRDGVLRGPREPVEVALLARAVPRKVAGQPLRALRVEGADVEQAVQLVEGGGEVRGGLGEVARGGAEVLGVRPGDARERPDLVADLRRGLAHERQHRAVGRVELAERRAQRLERRTELAAERVDLGERPLGLPQRARQLADRRRRSWRPAEANASKHGVATPAPGARSPCPWCRAPG